MLVLKIVEKLLQGHTAGHLEAVPYREGVVVVLPGLGMHRLTRPKEGRREVHKGVLVEVQRFVALCKLHRNNEVSAPLLVMPVLK